MDTMEWVMWRVVLAALTAALVSASAEAAALRGVVRGKAGPIENAIIYASPLAGIPAPAAAQVVIDQVDKRYVPFVTAIQTGTTVAFPNNDNIKHHVYSVSPAMAFERPLYQGQTAKPVKFEKPGEVVLGCNIHDWMIAHILVLETPYFARTDAAGKAVIGALPPGDYDVRVWHPGMKGKKQATQGATRISMVEPGQTVDFKIGLLPRKYWWLEKPADADKDYRGNPDSDGGN